MTCVMRFGRNRLGKSWAISQGANSCADRIRAAGADVFRGPPKLTPWSRGSTANWALDPRWLALRMQISRDVEAEVLVALSETLHWAYALNDHHYSRNHEGYEAAKDADLTASPCCADSSMPATEQSWRRYGPRNRPIGLTSTRTGSEHSQETTATRRQADGGHRNRASHAPDPRHRGAPREGQGHERAKRGGARCPPRSSRPSGPREETLLL